MRHLEHGMGDTSALHVYRWTGNSRPRCSVVGLQLPRQSARVPCRCQKSIAQRFHARGMMDAFAQATHVRDSTADGGRYARGDVPYRRAVRPECAAGTCVVGARESVSDVSESAFSIYHFVETSVSQRLRFFVNPQRRDSCPSSAVRGCL